MHSAYRRQPWWQELRSEFGFDTEGFYSADTFNENVPPSPDPSYLRNTSAAVYQVTTAHAETQDP